MRNLRQAVPTWAVIAFSATQTPMGMAQTCEPGVVATQPTTQYLIANGTATDLRTGLMWDQCPWGQSGAACVETGSGHFSWTLALTVPAAANAASYKGYSDWRLPNIKELRSIVESCRRAPSVNEYVFPNTPGSDYFAGAFWSSSPSATYPDGAWVVNFFYGAAYDFERRTSVFRIRLVRTAR